MNVRNHFSKLNIFRLKKQHGGDVTRHHGRTFLTVEIEPGCFIKYHGWHSGRVYAVSLDMTKTSFLVWAESSFASKVSIVPELKSPAGETILPAEDCVFGIVTIIIPELDVSWIITSTIDEEMASLFFGEYIEPNKNLYKVFSINVFSMTPKPWSDLNEVESVIKTITPKTFRILKTGFLRGVNCKLREEDMLAA